jgi:Ca2+-binding RTX toxin-like protein
MGTFKGNGRDNHLFGGLDDDHIRGLGGDDYLAGRGGNDWLRGGTGNDELAGGAGDDGAYGDTGDDRFDGAAGNDFADGGIGRDTGWGGRGDDTLVSFEVAFGGAGDDVIAGPVEGNAVLDGGTGDDDVKFWFARDLVAPAPFPDAPGQIIDVALGAGADGALITARVGSGVGWARISDFAVGEDRLELGVYAGDTLVLDTAGAFAVLDVTRDGRLDAADGGAGSPTGEVLQDQDGLHIRLSDDWLSLAGVESLAASDFVMTGIA